jgi:hypothetical protein
MMMPLQEGREKEEFEGVSLVGSDTMKEYKKGLKLLLNFIHKTSTSYILVLHENSKGKI